MSTTSVHPGLKGKKLIRPFGGSASVHQRPAAPQQNVPYILLRSTVYIKEDRITADIAEALVAYNPRTDTIVKICGLFIPAYLEDTPPFAWRLRGDGQPTGPTPVKPRPHDGVQTPGRDAQVVSQKFFLDDDKLPAGCEWRILRGFRLDRPQYHHAFQILSFVIPTFSAGQPPTKDTDMMVERSTLREEGTFNSLPRFSLTREGAFGAWHVSAMQALGEFVGIDVPMPTQNTATNPAAATQVFAAATGNAMPQAALATLVLPQQPKSAATTTTSETVSVETPGGARVTVTNHTHTKGTAAEPVREDMLVTHSLAESHQATSPTHPMGEDEGGEAFAHVSDDEEAAEREAADARLKQLGLVTEEERQGPPMFMEEDVQEQAQQEVVLTH